VSVGPGPPAVVFVNYRSEQLIDPRAERLLAAGFDVIVADNSGTYTGAGRRVDTGGNVGFGAACNAAVAALHPSTSVVVLHNPDVDASPDVLHELCDRLAAQPRPGLLGPAVREEHTVRSTGFREPGLAREAALAMIEAVGRGAGRRSGGGGAQRPAPDNRGRRFASAALLAVDVDAFLSIGGFDEAFFLYVEDVDLWRRIDEAGRSVGFAFDLVVDHANATGSAMGALDRAVLRWVGVELYVGRHRPWTWPIYRMVHLPAALVARCRGSDLARAVVSAWLRGRGPASVGAMVRARYGER